MYMYSFDERLYPQAEDFFSELHHYGLKTAGNIHDADGVANFEDQFVEMCTDLGLNPDTTTLVTHTKKKKKKCFINI
jgi:hypothetical protein